MVGFKVNRAKTEVVPTGEVDKLVELANLLCCIGSLPMTFFFY